MLQDRSDSSVTVSGITKREISSNVELLFSLISVTIPFDVPSSSTIIVSIKSSGTSSGNVSVITPISVSFIGMSVVVCD